MAQQHYASQGGVKKQCQQIHGAKRARPEQVDRQHRRAALILDPHERSEGCQAPGQRREHDRIAPAGNWRCNEPKDKVHQDPAIQE